MKRPVLILLICLCQSLTAQAQSEDVPEPQPEPQLVLNPELQELAAEFFAWRRLQQPASGDDIPRVERPVGWVPAFSRADLAIYRVRYHEFLDRLAAIDSTVFNRTDEVDALILSAAIRRVGWEIDVLKAPHRNPLFYLDQTLGSVFELLVLSSPMSSERLDEIILRFKHFPSMVENAKANLTEAVQPFAVSAIESLLGIEEKLSAVQAALAPQDAVEQNAALLDAVNLAVIALVEYRTWLQRNLQVMSTEFSIGDRAYQWFLLNVALIPNTTDELLAQGQQAWSRAAAWDVLERNHNRNTPELPVFDLIETQIEASFRNEREIRAFVESQNLLSIPDGLMHYRNRPMPSYLAPLAFMGVADDLSSETRLDEDAYRYLLQPSVDLPYFARASAMDPRPLIAHEGVPGHYLQLALSWAHPDPIRRRYIDSGANEGIAFYMEEMLLQAGLYSFSPRTREIIYSFMRLRALRVEVDIKLATGEFTIDQATNYLMRTVPMDRATAGEEAIFFASNPGQAISYQIGKLQIEKFLADARMDKDDAFSLRHFHDFLLQNGNLPIAVQRWEYLGRDDEIKRLQSLARQPATVPN